MKRILTVLLAFSMCTMFASCGCERMEDEELNMQLPTKITQVTPEGNYEYTYNWDFGGKKFSRHLAFTDPDGSTSTSIQDYKFTTNADRKFTEIQVSDSTSYKYNFSYVYDDKGRLVSQDEDSYTFDYNDKGFDFLLFSDKGSATTNEDGFVTSYNFTDTDKNLFDCKFTLDDYNNVIKAVSSLSNDGEEIYNVESVLTDVTYDNENITSAKIVQKTNLDEELSEERPDTESSSDEVDNSKCRFEIEYDDLGYPTSFHYSDNYENSIQMNIEYTAVSEKNFEAVTLSDVTPFVYPLNTIITLGDFNLFYFVAKTNALKNYSYVAQSAITYTVE